MKTPADLLQTVMAASDGAVALGRRRLTGKDPRFWKRQGIKRWKIAGRWVVAVADIQRRQRENTAKAAAIENCPGKADSAKRFRASLKPSPSNTRELPRLDSEA